MQPSIDPLAEVRYTLKDDKDNPTVFIIRGLSARMKSRMMSDTGHPVGSQKFNIDVIEQALLVGLMGWENWDGVPFLDRSVKSSQVTNVDRLTEKAYWELGGKIMELSNVSQTLEKK